MKWWASGYTWLTLILGGLAAFGCRSLGGTPAAGHAIHEDVQPAKLSRLWESVASSRAGVGDEVWIVDLVFDVVRVDLPVDGSHHSRKIWNHVDEMRVEASTASLLKRNGFRIGAASPDIWPALRAIIESSGGQVRREQLVAQRGLPLIIQLSAIEESESIFQYGREGALVGKTFVEGNRFFTLDYWYHPELGGSVDLQIQFGIRHDQGELTWERRDGIIRQVPAFEQHVFEGSRALLTLRESEFLVVGLSDRADNRFLVGSRFLISDQDGRQVETFFCITPSPFQSKSAMRTP